MTPVAERMMETLFSNSYFLCSVFYLKKYICSFRDGGGKPGVQEYAPDLEELDVEGMTPAWFAGSGFSLLAE